MTPKRNKLLGAQVVHDGLIKAKTERLSFTEDLCTLLISPITGKGLQQFQEDLAELRSRLVQPFLEGKIPSMEPI